MSGAAVHGHETEGQRIEVGCGDGRLLDVAIVIAEESSEPAEIVTGGEGAYVFAEGAAFAKRGFEEAAVLARQRRESMLAKIAARHDGGGDARDGEDLADGERADGGRRTAGQSEQTCAKERGAESAGNSCEKSVTDSLRHTHAPNQSVPESEKSRQPEPDANPPGSRACPRCIPLSIAGQPLRRVKIMGLRGLLCQRETVFLVKIRTSQNKAFLAPPLRSARIHATRLPD